MKHIASVALVGLAALLGCRGQVQLGSEPQPGAQPGPAGSLDASTTIDPGPEAIPDAPAVFAIPDATAVVAIPDAGTDGTAVLVNGDDAYPPFDKQAACAEAPAGVNSYATESDLNALIVGQWVRCQGILQPEGGLPAPDRQDGLEFDLDGSIYGLVSSELPLPPGGTGYLPYVGGGYGLETWQFWPGDGGVPGVLFEISTGSGGFADTPQFSNGGNRMALSDAIWGGTYVRFSHYSFNQ